MKNVIIKPLIITAQFKVEIDINELLIGMKTNTKIGEIKKNIGNFLRERLAEKFTPGEDITIPDFEDISTNLCEWDLVSWDDGGSDE